MVMKRDIDLDLSVKFVWYLYEWGFEAMFNVRQ